ncbi:hypothetical protein QJU89_01330 [Pasteurella skyensis]|uniref:Uncharacterized protein n=1 Tax=Phocoenobacter skyensis TaxID=97481 RepID=A0AAJ6NZN1_9PAST|nr:hypothetical protein [Pasteurella skyensis]MDP8161638.1 hypothetical protein [Pasteurella skyensis]MDP8171794.1 hypothetical protein [Pasteurella skyensis]MDP8176032.1 hypothetical protein [Pasteurella skyensis]MDP8178000.1 hypothetical protein [Pasteurella skyensis]MDP8182341.1 hypothetical protein [Pasteurella skyensis]
MNNFVSKTFGGLSRAYYIRQFLFGLIFCVIFGGAAFSSGKTDQILATVIGCLVLNVLYPYSRFVYESVINYIVGENAFFTEIKLFLIIKLITMAVCWIFSFAIAPIGLIYLYFYHSKQEKETKAEIE